MNTAVGLRERKKAATRTALGAAAMHLAVEVGVEHVTAEAIAVAANVSTRTFHNYFASKEEAILSAFREQFRSLTDQIRTMPADVPIWDVLEGIAVSMMSGAPADVGERLAQVKVIESPALVAFQLGLFDELERMSAEAIAERTGTDVATDLYPHLLAAAGAAAMKASMTLWERQQTGSGPAALIAAAFAQIRAGIPAPTE
ncbi:TetR/AcrR family transcriptional regulator [Kribbella sp. CA-245084]|uniref:TetR/AcrR family transcriptional regulator n=1 Tax=Kribbella sp. CA-245084 TaxID=3239940 RepID=UPI003D8B66FA